ncbi:hypothetical protein OG21DRAFT_1584308 [Imleria badia]|nr:hypothetical protein OG21DRAFT_1584308 [Imleria badia]
MRSRFATVSATAEPPIAVISSPWAIYEFIYLQTPISVTGSAGGVLSTTVNGTAITCNPVTVIGGGSGAKCTTQSACCTGNTFNGLVNIVCASISVDAA